MSIATLTIEIRVAWWVRPFLSSCVLFSQTFGVEPDCDRIGEFIMRHGLKVRT